jgi:hypothetical protein
MNTLTGFNTADQIIAALYNVSEFQSYKPGFNTIKINTSKSNTLDITNIENSHVGFNVLIPPPEINYSVPILGGIDNSGGVITIGQHASKIIIGNKNCITDISGAFNTSSLNTQSIIAQSIIAQSINTSGTLTLGELSDIVNLGNSTGTVNINGELNAQYIDSSGDILNIGLFSEKIELGNHEKNINVNGFLNVYDTLTAYNEIITPVIDNPLNFLSIGANTLTTTIGGDTTNVKMKNALINSIDSFSTNNTLFIGSNNTSSVVIGNDINNPNIYLSGKVFATNITNSPINTSYLNINSDRLNLNVSKILLNGNNGSPKEVITVDASGYAVWGEAISMPPLSDVTNASNYTNKNIIITDNINTNDVAASSIYLRATGSNNSLTINKDGISITNINSSTNISSGGINASTAILQNGYIKNNLSVTNTISTNTLNASTSTLKNVSITNNLSVGNLLNASIVTLYNGYITNNLSVSGIIDANNIITDTKIDISGQVVFNTPPHIPDPMFGNDAASKGYVDSLVGQYSGGLNLFLNNSLSSDVLDPSNNPCKLLLTTVDDASTTDVQTTITADDIYKINCFITDINYPGIVSLPQGLWSMTIYSDISASSIGIINYRFQLFKYSNGTYTHIATSTPSDDVNAIYGNVGSPTAYHMQAIISEQTFILTDRIAILLYAESSGVIPGSILTTFFEGEYYSYIQTTLNAGTNLLSSTNTWTGNNNFTISLTAPTLDSSDNSTNVATTAYVTTAVNNLSTSNNVWNGENNFSSLNVSVIAVINNASILNLSAFNVAIDSILTNNASMFNTSILNLSAFNASIDSITATNVSLFNVSVLNLSALNASVNSITVSNASMFNTSILNLSANNASLNTITVSNASMFNTSILNLSALNVSVNSITASNVSALNVSILNLSALNASVDSITASNVSFFNASILNASIDSITSSNVSMFNVSVTNLSASNASIFNASIYNLSGYNASITNLSARNASLYNASIYNLSGYNVSVTNLSARNASLYNASIYNLSGYNVSVTNLSARNASLYNASIYNLSGYNVSVTNLSAHNASLYNASIYNLSGYNVSVTNLSASNASLYNASIYNLSGYNVSITNLSASNA